LFLLRFFLGGFTVSTSLKIEVSSPCTGEGIVLKQDPTFYAGSNGDFTYAIVSRSPSDTQWRMVVFEYSRSTACTPTAEFEQETPNASDPTGRYIGYDSSGNPSSSGGTAVVSTFP
jgi:hypothetical protein